MSKKLKIYIIFITIIALFSCISNAETTNLYNQLSNETSSENSAESTSLEETEDSTEFEEETTENSEENSSIETHSYYTTNQNARINTMSSIPEANLGLNNVLCIILISIGVLLVLLAIAILIKLKK